MTIGRTARLVVVIAAVLAACVAGFVLGRQLRPNGYRPPTIRPATATLRGVGELSSFPGYPVLARRR
jgi:hypothetical protein